jgi:hypothetical protein
MHLDFPEPRAARFPYLESMANQLPAGHRRRRGDVIIRGMTGSQERRAARSGCSFASGGPRAVSGATGFRSRRTLGRREGGDRNSSGRSCSPAHGSDPKRKAFDEKAARIRASPGTMMIHLRSTPCLTGAPAS